MRSTVLMVLVCTLSWATAASRREQDIKDDETFKYKWLSIDGDLLDEVEDETLYVEISSTLAITEEYEAEGCSIVAKMLRNVPDIVFTELAQRGSVGLFTSEDSTTIFPEYEHMADRPECEGTCDDDCSDTCTEDGRKFDDLVGLGGIRATCLDDNFMCTPDDPNMWLDSQLVHEFSHTIHNYSLRYIDDWYDRVWYAWQNAVENEIWDLDSKVMSNEDEYFAQSTGSFFNVNHHSSNTGGMNSCGKPAGEFCDDEMDARAYLKEMDIDLYEILLYTYTDNQGHLASDLTICPE